MHNNYIYKNKHNKYVDIDYNKSFEHVCWIKMLQYNIYVCEFDTNSLRLNKFLQAYTNSMI